MGGHEKPFYVIDIIPEKNQLVAGRREELFSRSLSVEDLNWVAVPSIEHSMSVTAKLRSHQNDQPCEIVPSGDNEVVVHFNMPQMSITPGQSIVFYDRDIVLGGGVIRSACKQ